MVLAMTDNVPSRIRNVVTFYNIAPLKRLLAIKTEMIHIFLTLLLQFPKWNGIGFVLGLYLTRSDGQVDIEDGQWSIFIGMS